MSRIAQWFALAVLLSVSITSSAKDKQKAVLPSDVLRAETAYVMIHPDAGEPLTNLKANSQAREEVEKALDKWGRFRIVQDSITADLIFAVRTGSGQMVRPTAKNSPTDKRPVIFQPSDNGNIRIGGQKGTPPDPTQPTQGQDTSPRLNTEVGSTEDILEVYRGREDQPALGTSPVWRYSGKDALRAPKISAIGKFQDAITESEKTASQKAGVQKP